MKKDRIAYINIGRPEDVLFSRLRRMLADLKQSRAKPQQWIGTIQSFTQKGVKQAEIADTALIEFLKTENPDKPIDREVLLHQIDRRQPIIKRVDLGSPHYESWVSIDGSYTERLYILSSEAMRADDEIEDLIFQIEELGFDPGPLLKDPGLVARIEARMEMLRALRPDMYDFKHHHHSAIIEAYGKNLLAHSRFIRKDGLFFIQEIQSDWAQKGRRFNWGDGYPRAPLVTNTEQWAGMVVRDLLHEAALDPECQRVAWIRSNMRNGYNRSTELERDDLAVFYDDIVRKIVEKAIGKSGRPTVLNVQTKNGLAEVLGFEMTDSVRSELSKALPLYSRDAILRGRDLMSMEDPARTDERLAVMNECRTMLGDARTIRFVARLYDVSQGIEVAGKYLQAGIGACIEPSISVSMRADKLDRVARHEMWHFAEENFLYSHEKRTLRLEFSPGTALNERTREALRAIGLDRAAEQCRDHRECAAHAFALWCEGRLEVEGRPQGIFWSALKALERVGAWLSEKIFNVQVKSVEDLFVAMRSGALQHRQREGHAMEHPDQEEATQDTMTGPRG